MTFRAAWTAGLLGCALAAPCAFAQSSVAGETLVREGVELRRLGRDADALDRFSRAYAADHSPIALAQMGLAEQALGRWVASETHVRGALAVHDNPWIEQNRGAIEQAYAVIARHIGELDVIGGVPGAVVAIGGERVGVMPLAEPIHVPLGPSTIVVTAPGYLPVTRNVTVVAGETARETITLEHPTNQTDLMHPLAYAATGVAAASLVVAIIGGIVREGAVTAYNADGTCPGTLALVQSPDCSALIDRGNSMRALEIVGFVGAGVFGAAAATLFVLAPRHVEETHAQRVTPARFACGGGPGTVGIACAIRY